MSDSVFLCFRPFSRENGILGSLPLYIGIMRVGQYRSQTFRNYALNPVSVFTKGTYGQNTGSSKNDHICCSSSLVSIAYLNRRELRNETAYL